MKRTFQQILKHKRDYYGNTEFAIESAAEEFARQIAKATLRRAAKNVELKVVRDGFSSYNPPITTPYYYNDSTGDNITVYHKSIINTPIIIE